MTGHGRPGSTRRALLQGGAVAAGLATLPPTSVGQGAPSNQTETTVRWSRETDDHIWAMGFLDGRMYSAASGDLVAIDPATGDRELVVRDVTTDVLTGDGGLLVGSTDRTLEVFDPASWESNWTFETAAGQPIHDVHVLDGTVAVAIEGGTYVGLDRATGERAWTYPERRRADSYGYSFAAGGDGTYVVRGQHSGDEGRPPLVALDPADGSVRWKNRELHRCWYDDGTLYGTGGEHDLAGIDLESGEVAWTRQLPCEPVWPDTVDGVGYTMCNDGIAHLDGDHRVVWTYGDEERPDVAPLGVGEGQLYVSERASGDDDLEPSVAALDLETGERRWRFHVDAEEVGADRLGGVEVGLAYSQGVVLYGTTGEFRFLDSTGEVLAVHDSIEGVPVNRPTNTYAWEFEGVIVSQMDDVLAVFDPPSGWQSGTPTGGHESPSTVDGGTSSGGTERSGGGGETSRGGSETPPGGSETSAPGFGVGLGALVLGGVATWLARRRNQS